MGVVANIAASYRRPGRVVGRLLAAPENEGRALALLMGGCVILFVARWPALARQAHIDGTELQMLMGAALLGTVFILPLMLYVIAWAAHLLARAMGGQGSAYGARVALFWALVASTPLILLNGLVAGFIGPGPGQLLVGGLWMAVFVWFWIAGMRQASKGA